MNIDGPLTKRTFWALIAAILLLTFLSFVPVLEHDFLNYDDTKYLLLNQDVKDLSWASLKKIFLSAEGKPYNYVPLTLLSFALEHHFFGLDPSVYHLNNLILHVINTGLVFTFIWLLSRQWLMAALVAVLFGVHPMHVESVAWVSERKDVLYTLFFMGGLICYLQYILYARYRWLSATFVMFFLSCLSKPMAVTFPFILVLLDWFYKRPDKRKIILEKIPFVVAAALFVKLLMVEKAFAIIEFDEGFSWFERFLIACYTFYQYVLKAILPLKLSAFYPYPVRVNGALPPMYYWAPLISITLVAVFLYCFRKHRGMLFGFLFFLISIGPVLNFYPLGNMLMADRYTYIAYVGLFFILARGVIMVLRSERFNTSFKQVVVIAMVGFIIVLSIRTLERVHIWRSSETLWHDVVIKYPKEPLAYYNMADYFVNEGRVAQALLEYSNAIAAEPRYFSAYNNRGNLYVILGKYDKAIEDYEQAIRIYPDHIKSYMNLAAVYVYLKDYETAASVYDRVLSVDPENPHAREQLRRIGQLQK